MKDKKALFISEKAKDNVFENCEIEGAIISGRGTRMIRTKIYNFSKNHPNLWMGAIVTLVVTAIGSIIAGIVLRVI